jgi:hypothetical protein
VDEPVRDVCWAIWRTDSNELLGSATVVGDALLLTCAHVVRDVPTEVLAVSREWMKQPTSILAVKQGVGDLCVMTLSEPVAVVVLPFAQARGGDAVTAVGFRSREEDGAVEIGVARGVVSGRVDDGRFRIQDALLEPGNRAL